MTAALKYFRAVLLILGALFSESATSGSIENFTVAGWEGGAYAADRTGRFASCVVVAKYGNGTSLFFKMGAEYQVDIGITSPNWTLGEGERFDASLSVDDVAPFTGRGYAVARNAAIFPIRTDPASYDLFRRGRVLDVSFSGKTYRYRLDGTSRALARLELCVSENRDFAGPVTDVQSVSAEPAGPGPDRYRMIIDAAAMTANIAASSGLSGFRIVTDDNVRRTAGSPDVLWSSDKLVGFTNVFDIGGDAAMERRAATLATSRDGCRDIVRSATRREEINGVSVIHVMSECRDARGGHYQVQSVIVPRASGGFFEFTFMPADPAVVTETAGLKSAAMAVLTGG
ncbi:MAG TPA: hypothetical protein VK862_15750 [Afifellaceae bacterium]|nr:hypothetical protein [Afifellaceae bacterium]